jgi:hypothetical protein
MVVKSIKEIVNKFESMLLIKQIRKFINKGRTKMKKIAFILAAVLILMVSIPFPTYSLDLPLRVVVNGEKVNFPDAQPFIDSNSRTQVPVRFVSQALGASVNWADKPKQLQLLRVKIILFWL